MAQEIIETRGVDPSQQRTALLGIAASQLLVLTLWFSASAVAPQLATEWSLSTGEAAGLTLAVQIGFVAGALVLAGFGIADVAPARRLFLWAALFGAAANAAIATLSGDDFAAAIVLRLATGVALAGVYPSGLKVMAGWFERGRGMALGVLVGALTVGSAGPHLIRGLGLDWQGVIVGASTLAVIGALVMQLTVKDGPFEVASAQFSLSHVGRVLRNRGVRLSTYGYLGHMWELYAMWTWTASFLAASAMAAGRDDGFVATATFVVIASGGIGAGLAGALADRFGRTLVAGAAMVVSGSVALLSPLLFGAAPWLVVAVFVVWGIAVIADSAQFSAMVTETADDTTRGTALTLQVALGFLLTLVTIRGVPLIADAVGWQWAFSWLALGPMLGVLAMARLRRAPEARQIAGGLG